MPPCSSPPLWHPAAAVVDAVDEQLFANRLEVLVGRRSHYPEYKDQILYLVNETHLTQRQGPTLRDLAINLGLGTATVHSYCLLLQGEGLLEGVSRSHRSLRCTGAGLRRLEEPVRPYVAPPARTSYPNPWGESDLAETVGEPEREPEPEPERDPGCDLAPVAYAALPPSFRQLRSEQRGRAARVLPGEHGK